MGLVNNNDVSISSEGWKPSTGSSVFSATQLTTQSGVTIDTELRFSASSYLAPDALPQIKWLQREFKIGCILPPYISSRPQSFLMSVRLSWDVLATTRRNTGSSLGSKGSTLKIKEDDMSIPQIDKNNNTPTVG